jgi:drug/metabolite transporter (DMT)-like permease
VPPLRTVSATAWLGLGYVSIVSALFGFFAWYRGMALGGIARVSQTQLLQPVLSVIWAALLLGEPLAPETLGAAALVAACATWARQASAPGTARGACVTPPAIAEGASFRA